MLLLTLAALEVSRFLIDANFTGFSRSMNRCLKVGSCFLGYGFEALIEAIEALGCKQSVGEGCGECSLVGVATSKVCVG